MNQLSLSIEELIYCFYSEGFFEQGNALKQVYFGELDDEKMDLLLQITTRSLLSKSLLVYKDHKFTLVEDLVHIIATLNYSEQSIKASRHKNGGGEEAVSFHFNDNKILQHSLLYDEQVHTFTQVTLKEVSEIVSDFYHVSNAEGNDGFEITQSEFEDLLESLNNNEKLFNLPKLEGEQQKFYETLKQTDGFLNTLFFLEFDENKEPVAKNVILFTNDKVNNWVIEKEDDRFHIKSSSNGTVEQLINEQVNTSLEKVNHGQ
jgi:hypothetical protein